MNSNNDAHPGFNALRTMLVILLAALLVILVALAVVVPSIMVTDWQMVVPLALINCCYAFLMVAAVFPRLPEPKPVPAHLDDEAAASFVLAEIQPYLILRFALSEAPAIVGVAMTFLLPATGLMPYLFGMGAAFIMCWLTWFPRNKVFKKLEEKMQADGSTFTFAEDATFF